MQTSRRQAAHCRYSSTNVRPRVPYNSAHCNTAPSIVSGNVSRPKLECVAASAPLKPAAKQRRKTAKPLKAKTHLPERHTKLHPGRVDELDCLHFGPCSGCTLNTGIHNPPIAIQARQFFETRGFHGFHTVPDVIHRWRCRCGTRIRHA